MGQLELFIVSRPATSVWGNGGCSASYESFVVGSSLFLRLNFCAKNPPLRQAANRYGLRHYKHDIRLEQIKLNKENPEMEFELNSKDSYLLIHSVFVRSQTNFENEWTNLISKVKLTAELRYVVFTEQEGRFIDDKKKHFTIHFIPDSYQDQPAFHLNKLIKNETLTLGINPERKFYRILKLELQDVENLDEDYSLEFNIEKI